MFQRRMLLVANQLQNTQLTAPKLFSSKKKNQEESDDDGGDCNGGVEDVVNTATDNSQTAINNATSAVGKATASATTTIKSKLSAKPPIPKDFDAAASQLVNSSLKHRNDCMKRVKRNSVHVAFVAYLLVGMGVYATDIRNTGALGSVASRVIMGYYESITIGFSVGLGTKDPDYVPNVWFSSAYIIAGAAIIAVMLTVAGQQVEESASMSMFQSLQRRENYEKKMSRDNPLCTRIKAFLSYNAAYLIMITLWLCWLVFIIVWSMLMVDEWDFPQAQYFAVSLCSSAGSFSLPTTSSDTAYLLAGISMMIGVPLMAMGVSTIIIMVWQGHRFKTVKEAAWSDVTQDELELLGKLGVVDIRVDKGRIYFVRAFSNGTGCGRD